MDSVTKQLAAMAGVNQASIIGLTKALANSGAISSRLARAVIRGMANSSDYPAFQQMARTEAARITRNAPISARTRRLPGRPIR